MTAITTATSLTKKGLLTLGALISTYLSAAAQDTPKPDAKPDITISGDARVRYQGFRNRFNPANPDLDIADIRLRLEASYQPQDNVTIGARGVLETATDETLDIRLKDGSEKNIDRAFIDYANGPVKITIGEFDNPLAKHSWIDMDRPLEGATISYTAKDIGLDELSGRIIAHLGNHLIDWSDTKLYALSLDGKKNIGEDKLEVCASYLVFNELDNKFIMTNSKTNGSFANDFALAQLTARFGTQIGGMPITLSGMFGRNMRAEKHNQMYEAKITISPVKALSITGGYRSIERDALVASFTPNDTPSTNFEGAFGGLVYKFTPNTTGQLLIATPRLIEAPFDDQRQLYIAASLTIKF